MNPGDQTTYEPDKRSGVRPRTARKIAAALKVEPSEIAEIVDDES